MITTYYENTWSGAPNRRFLNWWSGTSIWFMPRLFACSAKHIQRKMSVFIELAKKAKTVRQGNALSGWLYRTTFCLAVNAVRTETRRRRRENETVKQGEIHLDGTPAAIEIEPVLDAAMQQLTRAEQNAVVLRFLEGKSLRDVGLALAVSEGAAQKRISRALEKLRAHFSRRGIAVSSTGILAALATLPVHAAPVSFAASLTGTSLVADSGAAAGFNTLLKTLLMTTKTKIVLVTAAVAVPLFIQHQQIAHLRQEVTTLNRKNLELSKPQTLPTVADALPVAMNAGAKRFNWELVEASDYRKYIANLRAAGCPDETIRDIIEADVMKLYDEKKKQVRKDAPKFEYWKGDDFLRGAGREAWMKMFALDEERDKVLRELGVQPNYRKKALKEQNGRDWMLDFLADDKKEQILRLGKEFENALTMRTDDRLNAKLLAEYQEAVKSLLTPEEALQYDLRTSPIATSVRHEMTAMEPTEEEFIALYKLRAAHERELQPIDTNASSADRQAQRKLAKEKLEEQIKEVLGPKRYADYQMAQDPRYQATHSFATQAGLGSRETQQIYQIAKEAEHAAAQIQNSPGLPVEQRGEALQAIRQETQRALQAALGEAAWEKYKHGGHNRWLSIMVRSPGQ